MTDEEKKSLLKQVVYTEKFVQGGLNGESYFLEDGMIVEFSIDKSYSNNCRFQINHDNSRYIWFSQLSNIFIKPDDLSLIAELIINKKGEVKKICEFTHLSFWDEVKEKKYRVEISGHYYIINKQSKTARENCLFYYQDIYDFVKKSVKNNRISDIGDCLKTAHAYTLIEI